MLLTQHLFALIRVQIHGLSQRLELLTGGGFLPSASKSLVMTLFVVFKAKHAPPLRGGG